VEFVRGNEVVWRGLTRSQLFLIPAMLFLAAYFVRWLRRRSPVSGSPVPEALDA
jgi:hypothetical protein